MSHQLLTTAVTPSMQLKANSLNKQSNKQTLHKKVYVLGNMNMEEEKHPKNWETVLWGKERLN